MNCWAIFALQLMVTKQFLMGNIIADEATLDYILVLAFFLIF